MKEILTLLSSNTWYNSGPTIEIAKGKYALPQSIKEAQQKIRRLWLLKK